MVCDSMILMGLDASMSMKESVCWLPMVPATSKKVTFKLMHDQVVKYKLERMTFDSWKLYLDSCATHHSAFVDWMLDNLREVNAVLKGNCNAGVTTSLVKGGYYRLFDMCLNKKGIANLLSIPWLEKDRYEVDSSTGKRIVFK